MFNSRVSFNMTPFTAGFQILPLFGQSRDRRYWEGQRLYIQFELYFIVITVILIIHATQSRLIILTDESYSSDSRSVNVASSSFGFGYLNSKLQF